MSIDEHTTKPTPAQARVIRQFTGDPHAHDGHRPPTIATYAICEQRGWIERIEDFPFRRTTPAGIAALRQRDHVGETTAAITTAKQTLALSRIDAYATGEEVGGELDYIMEQLDNVARRIASGNVGSPAAATTITGFSTSKEHTA